MRIIRILAIVAASTIVLHAQAVGPYADPLPLGNYVDSPGEMLQRAFAHNNWTLRPEADGEDYLGEISYKGFEIQVRVVIADQMLRLTVESVYATECISACRNLGDKPVLRWLVNLRRSIAYELTFLVRDKLQGCVVPNESSSCSPRISNTRPETQQPPMASR